MFVQVKELLEGIIIWEKWKNEKIEGKPVIINDNNRKSIKSEVKNLNL